MIFEPAEIDGAFVITLEPRADERGWFARAWCEEEFRFQGLEVRAVQTNVSFNHRRGTIRGLHWQADPFGEAKLVRCTAGAIFDVLVDVRHGSPTYGRWQGIQLAAGDRQLVHVPAGCAHGYQSQADGSEVAYNVSHAYAPEAERGIRWDDPAFSIAWPLAEVIVSEKDATWPDYALGLR
ncbi:MAG: dTDP-4-dehydrorhamnose 3,5-epimerase [Chloroflexota bacterium]|nr:dTDP-4-dehydrorhamnose 3,5-epimerase [Chloroflexota bacterium]